MSQGFEDIDAREIVRRVQLEGCATFRVTAHPDGTTETGEVMHPATEHVMKFFAYQHLPPHLQSISKACHDLAHQMAVELPENPETTIGLRKLLEAKDCFVRANVRPGDHCGTKIEGGETFKPDVVSPS